MNDHTRHRSYERVADLYAWLSGSEEKLPPWKRVMLEHAAPGRAVLVAGSGPGNEALALAGRGCRVTCVELSPRMLLRTRRRLREAGLTARLIEGDIMNHQRPGGYPVVVASFFLNIFRPPIMRRVLRHLADLVADGGMLIVIDFIHPEGRLPRRMVQGLNYRLAIGFYGLFGLSPWQRMHDYRRELPGVGLAVSEVHDFAAAPLLPPMYRTIIAERAG